MHRLRRTFGPVLDFGRAVRQVLHERRARRRELRELDEDGRRRRDLDLRAGFVEAGLLIDGDGPNGYERLADDEDDQKESSRRHQGKLQTLNSDIADW